MEKRILERTAKLERSNQELEQFAYVASHDLQEPLRTISNFVGLLESEIELKRIFQNLISNALKFKKKDGTPEINIRVHDNFDEYVFEVEDNGMRIKEEYTSKIFNIFQRLHSTSEYPGTGIGLATCKKIAALHNGRIWI